MKKQLFLRLKEDLVSGSYFSSELGLNPVLDKNEIFNAFEGALNTSDLNKKTQVMDNIYRFLKNNLAMQKINSIAFLFEYIMTCNRREIFCNTFSLFCSHLLRENVRNISSDFSDLFIKGNSIQKNFLKQEIVPLMLKKKHGQHNISLYISLNQYHKNFIEKEWPEIGSNDFLFQDIKGLNIRFSTLYIVENMLAFDNSIAENYALLLEKQNSFMEYNQIALQQDQKVYFYVYNFLVEHFNINEEFKGRFRKVPVDYDENSFGEGNVTLRTFENLFIAKNIGNQFSVYMESLRAEHEKKILKNNIPGISSNHLHKRL